MSDHTVMMAATGKTGGAPVRAFALLLLASACGTCQAEEGGDDVRADNDFRTEQSVRSAFADGDFMLGFEAVSPFPGGTILSADITTDPVLGALTTGFAHGIYDFEPCGVVYPHVHPRADESVFSVSGTVEVGFVDEAAALIRNETLRAGTSFVIPQGYIHYIANPTCKHATAFATVPSSDGGTFQLLPAALSLPPSILRAFVPSLEEEMIEQIQADVAAAGLVAVNPTCAARCAAQSVGAESDAS